MSARARFWLYTFLAFLGALLFLQALFPPDGAEVDLIHPAGVLAIVAEICLLMLAYEAWRAWRRER